MPLEQKGPWSGWLPSSSIWVALEQSQWALRMKPHISLILYWRLGLNHNSTTEFSNGIMTMYNIGHFLVLFNAFSFYGQPILLIWTNTFFYFLRYLYKFCNVIHVHFLITSIPDGDVAVIATANLCVLNWWSRIREVAKLQGKVKKKKG